MKTLIIDSHKGFPHENATNLHVRNARIIAEKLGATLIASHAGADEIAQQKWDRIVFNHASGYSNVDYKCLEMNPEAKLCYITNEYNLGEPQLLWMAAKTGRKYNVIANHPPEASKVVKKYVDNWDIVNLNAIIFEEKKDTEEELLFPIKQDGVVYYGSFRANRKKYFEKYFDERIYVSTSKDNIIKFGKILPNLNCKFIGKLKWKPIKQLKSFAISLYIEDEKTHKHYNHLANRFYEAISCGVTPVFDYSCVDTTNKSGYCIPEEYFCKSPDDLHSKTGLKIKDGWIELARVEKKQVLDKIKALILD